jgi:hypothetical protein
MLLLVELVELKEKHMARVEELDVLHLEVEELRSRPLCLVLVPHVLICMLGFLNLMLRLVLWRLL